MDRDKATTCRVRSGDRRLDGLVALTIENEELLAEAIGAAGPPARKDAKAGEPSRSA